MVSLGYLGIVNIQCFLFVSDSVYPRRAGPPASPGHPVRALRCHRSGTAAAKRGHRTLWQAAPMSSRNTSPTPTPAPEQWRIDAGDADVALLDIPPVSDRVRRFDVDVSFIVRTPAESSVQPWHELAVELDGRKQWSRRINSSNPGEQDGLDYHVSVSVDAGAPLRVRALTKVRGALRHRLLIEATEG